MAESNEPDCELSVVMPCLNEARTLGACIEEAASFLSRAGIAGEIVVGDNGSQDGSQAIAAGLGARVVNVPMRGYGAALYFATCACRGKYVIMADSDGSYDFSALDPFIQKLREGYDLVMGDRFRGGIEPGAMPWKNRFIGNPVLSSIGRLFFRSAVRDFHCGLRAFSMQAFRRLNLRTTGMEYASEMVIKAILMRMQITDVPTTLRPDGRNRPPHLRPWRDGWRHLRFMLLYSPRWLFLMPGLLLMLISAAAMAALIRGPVHVRGIVFDVNTLLFAAAGALCGAQSIFFSLFAKVFAIGEGLLPEDPALNRLFKYLTLETGLIIGSLLLLLGSAGAVISLAHWRKLHFGELNPRVSLRVVVPCVAAVVLGVQIILSSFFLSVLGLRVRTRLPVGDESSTPSLSHL